MPLFEALDRVPWDELLHQDHPQRPATNVPVLLRALAAHGPNHEVVFDANVVGGVYGERTALRVARSVAVEFNDLMRVSPVTPRLIPFMIELCGSAELTTRRFCVRWLQSFFKHSTLGGVTAKFRVESHEEAASWVEGLGLPDEVFLGVSIGLRDEPHAPAIERALELLDQELDEDVNVVWNLESRIHSVWIRDSCKAIDSGLEVVLGLLALGDEALCAEVIALTSWLPQRAQVIAPHLEAVAQAEHAKLLGTMALVALARLGQPVAAAVQVTGDVLESRGEQGLPAIYLAVADVLDSKGLAGPKSRRALLKVAPPLARLPDPFGSTVAELVKVVAELLVWPKR